MGLFKKSKDNRKELKGQVDKLMKQYQNKKIDGPTYAKRMMNLTTSYQKKNKK